MPTASQAKSLAPSTSGASKRATDNAGHVYGYEGLFCIDSSIIPTSLGVNPSLTIAAVSERAADALVIRSAGLGLPARPAGFRPGIPSEIVGERVVPKLPAPAPKRRRKKKTARKKRARPPVRPTTRR